jgi:hypothetical protein
VADYLPAGGIVGAIGDMLTLIEELHRRKAELAARHADPFRAKVEDCCAWHASHKHTRASRSALVAEDHRQWPTDRCDDAGTWVCPD